jgi:hypothetical protein
MTVETDLDRAQYATNGTTGPWTVPYYFLADDELSVTYTTAAGVDTALALNVDYTVVGAGNVGGGTVTTTQAYSAGGQLVILRDVQFVQQTEYVDGDAFPAKTHERALDRLTMIGQQLRERLNRAITLPASFSSSAEVGDVATRRGKMLGFDAITGAFSYITAAAGSALDLALQYASSSGASLIGYVHSFLGAVQRPVQDRLRDLPPSFADAGAVIDGSTDNLVAVNLLLSKPRNEVVVKEGTDVRVSAVPTNSYGPRMGPGRSSFRSPAAGARSTATPTSAATSSGRSTSTPLR